MFLFIKKHLEKILDTKSKLKICQVKSTNFGLLRKPQNILPQASLLKILKSFVRSYLDYRDAIYDQVYNNPFNQKIAIRGLSKENFIQNSVWNPYNYNDGIGNFAIFKLTKKFVYLSIYLSICKI